ncbi:GNAT family N-acetyltransferase [Romboutsia sp.]|uniref:GNAT family N-acetyltransferase n=1 Tax=Romboutsia sp. TaxID=1965302 RepID=UPI003F2D267A
MIRKLTQSDKEKVLKYVSKESSINLFIIGDIEQFGFDKDFQEIWGKFDEFENIKAVLLRYTNNFIVYYENQEENIQEFKEIIKNYNVKKMISGREDLVQVLKTALENYNERKTYFCELKDKSNLLNWDESVKLAVPEDAERIYNLLETIEEFVSENDKDLIKDRVEDKSIRVYYIENDEGEMISISQTAAENSKSAMVVGVATRAGYRKKGYISKCLSRLCNDLLDEGKILCLFYDNPQAGKVYHKIGFREIGKWTMLVEK